MRFIQSPSPSAVTNFLSYVSANRYDNTVIHRNSDTRDTAGGPLRDFVIQGGGYSLVNSQWGVSYNSVQTNAAIADEPGGGVAGPSNLRGTIAMAKSGPNTVTSQWFINQGDNSILDSPSRSDGGFSAFGMVLGNGMTVVDAIGDLPVANDVFPFGLAAPFNDLPLRNFHSHSTLDLKVANTVTVRDVRVLNLLPGDFDRNGVVNQVDLAILNANFGKTSGAFVDQGDADMDGDVDGADLFAWQSNENTTNTPVSSAPEPNSLVLSACGLSWMGGRRRLSRRFR
jgi:cyclophilin family peptidyl-prolyl cis-trans isomerase